MIVLPLKGISSMLGKGDDKVMAGAYDEDCTRFLCAFVVVKPGAYDQVCVVDLNALRVVVLGRVQGKVNDLAIGDFKINGVCCISYTSGGVFHWGPIDKFLHRFYKPKANYLDPYGVYILNLVNRYGLLYELSGTDRKFGVQRLGIEGWLESQASIEAQVRDSLKSMVNNYPPEFRYKHE